MKSTTKHNSIIIFPETISNSENTVAEPQLRELAKVIEDTDPRHNKEVYSISNWHRLTDEEKQDRINQARAILKYIKSREW